jgi:hypothetical protein
MKDSIQLYIWYILNCKGARATKMMTRAAHTIPPLSMVITQQPSWVLQRAANAQQVENDWRKVWG